ncbi:MAG: hypothetical protein OEY89_08205, partial [Gammaproteobacteria bacterium]|nr:hypothetical protein [Gammaproteobacteria bacterium]
AILLGKRDYVSMLEPYVFKAGNHQKEAIQIAFRVLPLEQSRQWVSRFVNEPDQLRNVIIATGILGDPHAVDWLLLKMRELNYARVAAESFCMITGADLEKMLMTIDAPEHVDDGPTDDPDDANVSMHDDENLPWPNVELVASYWNGIRSRFIVGQRYLLGKPVELSTLVPGLTTAYQRQRHAIAYEIAMLDKSEKLINTRSIVSRKY